MFECTSLAASLARRSAPARGLRGAPSSRFCGAEAARESGGRQGAGRGSWRVLARRRSVSGASSGRAARSARQRGQSAFRSHQAARQASWKACRHVGTWRSWSPRSKLLVQMAHSPVPRAPHVTRRRRRKTASTHSRALPDSSSRPRSSGERPRQVGLTHLAGGGPGGRCPNRRLRSPDSAAKLAHAPGTVGAEKQFQAPPQFGCYCVCR